MLKVYFKQFSAMTMLFLLLNTFVIVSQNASRTDSMAKAQKKPAHTIKKVSMTF